MVRLFKFSKFKLVIAGAVVLVLGLAYWLIALPIIDAINASRDVTATQNQSSVTESKKVCSDDLLTKSAKYISDRDTTSLGGLISEITALSGYQQDPNCLYIKLQYNFLNNISSGNSVLISDLEKVYINKDSISSIFGSGRMTLNSISERAKTLEDISGVYDKAQEDEQKRLKKELEYVESNPQD